MLWQGRKGRGEGQQGRAGGLEEGWRRSLYVLETHIYGSVFMGEVEVWNFQRDWKFWEKRRAKTNSMKNLGSRVKALSNREIRLRMSRQEAICESSGNELQK